MSKTHNFQISELHGFEEQIIIASSVKDRKKLVIVNKINNSTLKTYLLLIKTDKLQNQILSTNYHIDDFLRAVDAYNKL